MLPLPRSPLFVLAATVAALPTSLAHAGGFEFPDNGVRALGRGGAFVARADDPTAIYHNPSGITRLTKPSLLVDLNVSHVDYRFKRAPTRRTTRSGQAVRVPEQGGFEEVSNSAPPFPAPFVSYVHPLSSSWALAAGIYGPSAYGWRDFPDDGPQRYELTNSEILLTYTTLAIGWQGWGGRLRLGASLQAASVPKMHIELKTDGDPGILTSGGGYVQSEDPRWDNTSVLDLSRGFIPTGILGVTVAPTDSVEVGLSYRPGFELRTEGTVSVQYSKFFTYDPDPDDPTTHNVGREEQCATIPAERRFECSRDAQMSDDGASLTLNFPHIVKAGVRYVDRVTTEASGVQERWDVELDVTWERWSTLRDITVEFDGQLSFNPFFGNGDTLKTVPLRERPIVLPHDWQDVVSVRLGGDFRATQALTLRAGATYETSTFPKHAVDLLAEGFPRTTAAVGASYDLTDDLRLSTGFTMSFSGQFTSEKSQVAAQIPLSECTAPFTDAAKCTFDGEPTGNPVGEGSYNNRITLFGLGLTAAF